MSENTKLVVAKVGSSTLVDSAGALDRAYIGGLCDQIATLSEEGVRVIVVSSGAAVAGREALGMTERPSDIPTLQACAAAGQASLIETYAHALAERDIHCAQVLLTRRDVCDREGYLNARNTFERLLELGCVPIVNENDTVSVAEFAFGDNDMLGAIVAALTSADLYVILSDVEGLYTANPQLDPTATLIEHVDQVDRDLAKIAGGSGSSFGTGGMASKLRAARSMLAAGIPTVICQGRGENALVSAVHGDEAGTRFEGPADAAIHGNPRKLWIGLAEVTKGTLTLDEGATRAVAEQGASILPVGVVSVEGSFAPGDVVDVCGPDGYLIARGAVRYSSEELERYRGLKLDVIARFTGVEGATVAVHRDELLVF